MSISMTVAVRCLGVSVINLLLCAALLFTAPAGAAVLCGVDCDHDQAEALCSCSGGEACGGQANSVWGCGATCGSGCTRSEECPPPPF